MLYMWFLKCWPKHRKLDHPPRPNSASFNPELLIGGMPQWNPAPNRSQILWYIVIQRNHDILRHTVDMFHSFPVRIIVRFKKGIRQRAKCWFLCQECVSFVSVSVCVCAGTCLYFNARQLFQHGSIKWSSLVRWVISASMLHQSLLRGERRHSFEVEA